MTVRAFETYSPDIDDSAYVDETALVSGQVWLAEDSSVWPMTVLRGDVNRIVVGKRSNIQDGTVVHVSHASAEYTSENGSATIIGDDVTIGHKAVIHACTIEDRVLVGMGAIVLDNAVIEADTIIGAGSLVPPNKRLEGGYLWLGSPVKKARPLTEKEKQYLAYSAAHYVRLKNRTI